MTEFDVLHHELLVRTMDMSDGVVSQFRGMVASETQSKKCRADSFLTGLGEFIHELTC